MRRTVEAVAAAAVAATTIPSVLPMFAGGGTGWLLAAVAVPAAVAAVSTVIARAGRPWVRAVADLVGVVALLAAMPADPEGRAALGSLPSGPKLLITAALPAAPAGPELGVAVVILAIAAWAAAELALRPEARVHARTAGGALLPLAPAAAVYVAVLAVGAGGLPAPRWGALVFAGGAGVAVALRRATRALPGSSQSPATSRPVVAGSRDSGPAVHIGQLTAGAGLLAVALALALPLSSHLPGAGARQPYNLRAAISAAPRPADQLNLLSSYASIYDAPVRTAMTVRMSGADAGSLWWRMATYPRFTGTEWTTDATFQRAGLELPPGPATDVRTATVTADVTLDDPTGYLPAPDRPVRVSVPGLDVSRADGVLAVPAGSTSPRRYQVTSVVAEPTNTQFLAARPATPADRGDAPVPPQIAEKTSTIIAGTHGSAFSRLTAIETYLRNAPFSHQPPGRSSIGSGTYQVLQLLQSKRGSSEQYASAFALLARAAGFDTRLAVGYTGGTENPRTGEVVFTNHDLAVWPEVHLDGIGWAPFPATPGNTAVPPAPAHASGGLSQALHQQQQFNQHAPPATVPASPPTTLPAATPHGYPWAALAAGIVVGVPAVAVASLVVAKLARRRRQRGQRDPTGRVLGAWEFVLDRLAELGVGVGAPATSTEVVQRAAAELGPATATPLSALADAVDATRFDRRFPPAQPVADAAWRDAAAFDRHRREAIPRLRRMRSALSPAPWRR